MLKIKLNVISYNEGYAQFPILSYKM